MDLPDTVYIAEYPFFIGIQLFIPKCKMVDAFFEHELSLDSYMLDVAVES